MDAHWKKNAIINFVFYSWELSNILKTKTAVAVIEMDRSFISDNMVTSNNSMTTLSPASSKPSGDAFTSLYPAIVECFTIILFGYITGRGGWITSSQAKGLNTFTSKFALPALLFSNMATLDWSVVGSLWRIYLMVAFAVFV